VSRAGIEVAEVTVRFGALTALMDVTFSVDAGSSLAVLGPNGAGKTTLLKIIAGLAKPTSGTVRVGDTDIATSAEAVRRQLGVVSHQTMLYDDLTARENLSFYGRLYGLPDLNTAVSDTLESVGLVERADDRVRTFSRGMKQRLAIARATIHDPQFLLFDEPFTGLDVAGRDTLSERIDSFRALGRTAILVTHDLQQALSLSDRFLILSAGRVVEIGSTDDMTLSEIEGRYQAATRFTGCGRRLMSAPSPDAERKGSADLPS
jgi:heme ABC exporter ATP-binding subunit CcmA